MKVERNRSWAWASGVGLLLTLGACSGKVVESGDGDGDEASGGTAGDGDAPWTGGKTGDGDGDGDLPATGGFIGDGDGDVACTDYFAMGLTVTVLGGGLPPVYTGAEETAPPPGEGALPPDPGDLIQPPDFTCYATVIAVDGDYEEMLTCYSDGTDCTCSGAGERAGSYTVTATHGEKTETEEVVVERDACHVIPETIVFFD